MVGLRLWRTLDARSEKKGYDLVLIRTPRVRLLLSFREAVLVIDTRLLPSNQHATSWNNRAAPCNVDAPGGESVWHVISLYSSIVINRPTEQDLRHHECACHLRYIRHLKFETTTVPSAASRVSQRGRAGLTAHRLECEISPTNISAREINIQPVIRGLSQSGSTPSALTLRRLHQS